MPEASAISIDAERRVLAGHDSGAEKSRGRIYTCRNMSRNKSPKFRPGRKDREEEEEKRKKKGRNVASLEAAGIIQGMLILNWLIYFNTSNFRLEDLPDLLILAA